MAATDLGGALVAPAATLAKSQRIERALFWLCVLAAGSLMWLVPRPPLTDLPQHAGQIALWRDLLKGDSPWSHLVFINLLTPYLIGYGLALPLSFVMPVEAAIAVVTTAAFYAFVAGCVALRREFDSDDRLDWLFLPSFFGFAWHWGFYTFVTASPVLLAFILATLRYRRVPVANRGAVLLAAGVALLFSHGLLFLFGLFAAGLLLLGRISEPFWSRAARLWPVFALLVLVAVFALVTRERGTSGRFVATEFGTPLWLRPLAAISFITSDNWDTDPILACLSALALSTPFFIGSRLNRGPALTLFAALGATFLFVPAYAFQTGYLFPRFAIFLPPFLAFSFRRADPQATPEGAEWIARATMALACMAILAIHAWRVEAFKPEAASFARIEQAAVPGKRALAFIFDGSSPAAHAAKAYVHFPSWYQADRRGFVDYNFADQIPQVVRFRRGETPAIGVKFVADYRTFDWREDQAWIYDYFFFRGAVDALSWLRARSPCRLALVAVDGPWSLVRRISCPPSPEGPR